MAPEQRRHGHVEFFRHHIREVKQCKSGLMGVDSLSDPFAVRRPERPEGVLSIIGPWIPRETVEAAPFAYPVAGFHMIRMSGVLKTGIV